MRSALPGLLRVQMCVRVCSGIFLKTKSKQGPKCCVWCEVWGSTGAIKAQPPCAVKGGNQCQPKRLVDGKGEGGRKIKRKEKNKFVDVTKRGGKITYRNKVNVGWAAKHVV